MNTWENAFKLSVNKANKKPSSTKFFFVFV